MAITILDVTLIAQPSPTTPATDPEPSGAPALAEQEACPPSSPAPATRPTGARSEPPGASLR